MNLLSPEAARERIIATCNEVRDLLVAKNESYGNSAFAPEGTFSRLNAISRLEVRIDDKLQRIRSGSEFPGDDTVLDLIGYLVLLRIAWKAEQAFAKHGTSDLMP